jgi:hypothetical protein
MRKAAILFVVLVFVTQSFGGSAGHTVTVSGCVMNMNGTFRLLTPGQTYILKGRQNALFSYNGKLVEVTGTVDSAENPSPGIPVVLHVTKLKKIADFCH